MDNRRVDLDVKLEKRRLHLARLLVLLDKFGMGRLDLVLESKLELGSEGWNWAWKTGFGHGRLEFVLEVWN